MTLLIQAFEPGMSQFGDAAWYCFVSCTTIGFGDFTAVSFLGRMVTVVLYLLTVVVIALITATITQYFLESMKAKHDGSMALFVDQLERLPELSHEELVEISEKVKKHNANKD